MKKLTFLAALLIVISAASFAEDRITGEKPNVKPKFKMVAKSDVKFDLYYESEESGEVCVIIYDENGRKMSDKTIRKVKTFKRTYDFSKLKPGKYKVVVRNETGTANQEIIYQIKKARLQTFVSKLPDSQSLKLHVGDFDTSKPVLVKIYNQNYELIHTDEIKNAKSFSRIYNLNNMQLETVSVLIENSGERKTFTHSFN